MPVVLMFLPVYLFARTRLDSLSRARVRVFLGVVLGVTVLFVAERPLLYEIWPRYCDGCRKFAPFPALAEQLRAAGFKRGTIVAKRHHTGGNLKLIFKESRVIVVGYPLSAFPEEPVGDQCLIVWRGKSPEAPREMRDYLRTAMQAPAFEPIRDGVVEAGLINAEQRRFALSYTLIDGGVGTCR